jgi:hypothetical protein
MLLEKQGTLVKRRIGLGEIDAEPEAFCRK